ncbi:hypothetical protein DTO271G3_194 [Paecilomyces variotii]|nr:hypothetical protein DTO271G3_194 [Paecilomyces variotii]
MKTTLFITWQTSSWSGNHKTFSSTGDCSDFCRNFAIIRIIFASLPPSAETTLLLSANTASRGGHQDHINRLFAAFVDCLLPDFQNIIFGDIR